MGRDSKSSWSMDCSQVSSVKCHAEVLTFVNDSHRSSHIGHGHHSLRQDYDAIHAAEELSGEAEA